MTQLEAALKGIVTPEMTIVAEEEGISVEILMDLISRGRVVIPANRNHKTLHPRGIGRALRVKVNANIGTSPKNTDIDAELEKLSMIEKLNAESVMDLSIAGDMDHIRETIISASSMMVGTVPIYQVLTEKYNDIDSIDIGEILKTNDKHGRQGVDFITVHCGLTKAALPFVENRVMGIVSRGGSFIARWMKEHGRENPLYEHYDRILEIAKKHDMTLSLGDGLRPGAGADATDKAQLHELNVLGELTKRARAAGVQVMVEGPGHVPFNQIEENMRLQREICDDAPSTCWGPLQRIPLRGTTT